ncbi:hypothetical protein CBL_04591 [Carabus blaptoides fortunei]
MLEGSERRECVRVFSSHALEICHVTLAQVSVVDFKTHKSERTYSEKPRERQYASVSSSNGMVMVQESLDDICGQPQSPSLPNTKIKVTPIFGQLLVAGRGDEISWKIFVNKRK